MILQILRVSEYRTRCVSLKMVATRAQLRRKSKTAVGSYNELNICLKSSVSSAYCQGSETPGYKITWNRHGNTELYTYNGQTGWVLQKK